MHLKHGTKLQGLRTEILVAAIVAQEVYEEECQELTITSAVGRKHGKGSLHYVGLAIDLRTRDLDSKEQKARIVQKIRDRLTDEFDVVSEKDHIHIEYQPK